MPAEVITETAPESQKFKASTNNPPGRSISSASGRGQGHPRSNNGFLHYLAILRRCQTDLTTVTGSETI